MLSERATTVTGPVLSRLSPEQRAAVTHAGGPAVVLAGAGAGKTRVLCHRLAWLVDGGARPDEVLALTFTREAAQELRARAEDLLGRSHESLRVLTFHAYAIDLARIHGSERGLLPEVARASSEERMILLLERIGELDLRLLDLRGDTAGLVAELVRRIDRCKDQLVDAGAYRRWAEAAVASAGNASAEHRARRELEFARVYEAHDRWLAEDGLEDFGESIVRALTLLRRHPDRLAAAREGVRHALVDEFQDTNHAQAELLHLVAGDAASLMVVGDDDQGIYRFRGASTKNVADFLRVHPDAQVLRLERNYRSTQAILDASGAVVAPVPGRTPKTLVADAPGPGAAPRFWRAPDPDGAARAVVDEVVRLAREGVPYEEQAVLMRAVRLEARPVTEALERAGVPHQVRGGVGLLERREVRAAMSWLRAVTDVGDAQAHLRIAADPALGLPWTAAAEAVSAAATARRPVQSALLDVARAAGAPRLERVLDELGRAVAERPPAEALRVVLDRSGVRHAALAAVGA
jgi:DNA helicase II / ATP-dependent DNA helicase PcrA